MKNKWVWQGVDYGIAKFGDYTFINKAYRELSDQLYHYHEAQIRPYFVADWASKTEQKMKTPNSMMKRLLDGDTQKLVKAGFINSDLELTQAGKDELWALILDQNRAALVTAAQARLDEEAK